MRNSRRRWSKSIGARGNRVRLYEARPGGPIMRSIWINGKEDRKSLGHRDRELATRQAWELLHGLVANDTAIEEQSITLGMLTDLYLESPQHLAKKERTRKEDARKLRRVVNFLGPNRNVVSLSESDVRRYSTARRAGDKRLQGVVPEVAVKDRTVELDLVLLMAAFNWATRERTSTGRRLVRENPLHGVKLPREKNPRRPVMRHDVYLKLLEASRQIHPLLTLALVVAEGTGRRISGWRNLRWDDVDFQAGTIRWRAAFDKKGYEDVVPMSDAVGDTLREARKVQRAIGNAPVFPSSEGLDQAVRPAPAGQLAAAGLREGRTRTREGGLWHSLRRKWATERKGYPVKDVAAAGGWRDEATMLVSYQQVDAETIRRVVLQPTQRLMGS